MKYYVVKLLTNTAGEDGSSVTPFTSEKAEKYAKVEYHNTLAAFHNAEDVLYAIVQIVNEYGNCEIMEIVDHKPIPEPEPVEPEENTEE